MQDCFHETRLNLQALTDSGGVCCVLVKGPSGCGKTTLLLELAAACGKRQGEGLLYLHLGEQVDGKVSQLLLVGEDVTVENVCSVVFMKSCIFV